MLKELHRALSAPTGTVEVCPNETCPAITSEWAKTALNFQPESKKAEVLDTGAKYLILCCNRQWACASGSDSKSFPFSGVCLAWPTPRSTFPLRSGSRTRQGMATAL